MCDIQRGRTVRGGPPSVRWSGWMLVGLAALLLVGGAPSGTSSGSMVEVSSEGAEGPVWSCTQWDPCLNASWAPAKPTPQDRINFTVTVLTADDYLSRGMLYYKYKIPYQGWEPAIDWYSFRMTNTSNQGNKEAYHDMHNWKGGTLLQVWFEAYDLEHNRLKSPIYQIEVSGNDTWVCDVPDGYDDCIETHFGFINEGYPQEVEDGGDVPSYSKIYVDITSIRGLDVNKPTSIRAGIVMYWFEDGDGNMLNGPFQATMDPMNSNRTNMSTEELYTSDADQFLRFNISVYDMYDRMLRSIDYTLHVSGEDFARPNVPVWMNVVVTFVDEVHGTSMPLVGVRVTFVNSSGVEVTNVTDAQGKASYFTYQKGKDTWTMRAVYKRVVKEVRDTLPNATRIRHSNFTYYLTFLQKDIPAPFQEEVDENYFLWGGAGIATFIIVFAPLSARFFMEKRRRDEIKRMEKEARFKI